MTTISIGKTVYIGLTPPLVKNIAGYQGVTWVKVNGIVTTGQLGFNHETIPAPDLESGITMQFKGARTGSGGQLAYRTLITAGVLDPGQAAIAAANEQNDEVSLQVVNPDGTTANYWTGILHSLIDNESSTSSYEGKTCVFVPNYPVVSGPSDTA